MRNVRIQNKLHATHLGQSSKLYPLISSKTKFNTVLIDTNNSEPFWTADWWGLDQSDLFCGLTLKLQRDILNTCNRTVLNEAYFIEKSGLAYSAKMSLLADSTDTAQLYALIGADEAKHLAWIEPYVSEEDKINPYGQFLSFLSSLVEDAPPYLLVYLVQIILEGWGLEYYKRLGKHCQHSNLSEVFHQIVRDEALHHKSGHILFDVAVFSEDDWLFVRNTLKRYAEMVRVGPLAIVEAIDRVLNMVQERFLMREEVEALLLALRHSEESLRKLVLLKTLMRAPGMEAVVDELEDAGYFLPMSVQDAADAYLIMQKC